MKTKVFLIIVLTVGLIVGGYSFYHHNYRDTLMLSEIVGHSDNVGLNIVIDLADFDTGLTRHEIKLLKKSKDYWFSRIQEVDAIDNSDMKEQASLKLLSDMMEDPVLKKILSGVLKFGTSTALGLLEIVL